MPSISIDEFIRSAIDAPDLDNLSAQFEGAAAGFGFELIAYNLLQRNFRPVASKDSWRVRKRAVASDLFRPDQVISFDPVITARIAKFQPYYWREIDNHPALSAQMKTIMCRLHDTGFQDGLSLPVIAPHGAVVLFSFSARNRRLALTPLEMRRLQSICEVMHARYEELSSSEPLLSLPSREMEIMAMVARGKSNAEIAKTLLISPHTVDTLLRRTFLKLGVGSRVEACMRLASAGLLSDAP